MELMRNREGYHDPTACRAIRNASRRTRKGKNKKSRPLTYRLEELRVFQECAERRL